MPTLRCTICDRPFDSNASPAMPFCSTRCRQVDLGRWMDERYGLLYDREDESEDSQASGLGPDSDG